MPLVTELGSELCIPQGPPLPALHVAVPLPANLINNSIRAYSFQHIGNIITVKRVYAPMSMCQFIIISYHSKHIYMGSRVYFNYIRSSH